MQNTKHYAWAIQEGLFEAWKEDGQIYVRSNANSESNSVPCKLSKDDALEIATLLYHIAQGTEGY